MPRIIILGGPRVGKTTISERLKEAFAVPTLRGSDDIKHLGWSESSAEAAKWFDEPGDWIVEGVQMARALRKWLLANANKPLDADVVSLGQPFEELSAGQQSMTAGVQTVLGDIEAELLRRGVRIHKLKDPEDAINLLRGVDMADDNDEGKEKPDHKEAAGLKKRLDKHQGDAMALAAELSAENADLNRQLRAVKGEKPKEGSLVLTPEQKTQWEAFIALGKPEEVIAAYQEYAVLGKAEDLKTKIATHADLEKENASLKKDQELSRRANEGVTIDGKTSKLDLEVLSLIDKSVGGLVFEDRDVIVDGKTQKVPHVKVGDSVTPFADYLKTKHAKLLPSLIGSEVSNGTRVPGQTADDKSKAGANIFDDIRKQAAEGQKQQIESIPLEKRLHMA